MKYIELIKKIETNIFTTEDVLKHFQDESDQTIRMQMSRFLKQNKIARIKRGLYAFDTKKIDNLVLANLLYKPSYISLETALNYYGIIPDISQSVTSISPTNTKKINTSCGHFIYTKILQKLYFGFVKIESTKSKRYYQIAQKEKAVLDYLYIRKISSSEELRMNTSTLDARLLKKYSQQFPEWVQKIKITI